MNEILVRLSQSFHRRSQSCGCHALSHVLDECIIWYIRPELNRRSLELEMGRNWFASVATQTDPSQSKCFLSALADFGGYWYLGFCGKDGGNLVIFPFPYL